MEVALGNRYRSPAILLDVPDDGRPASNPFEPTGLPGTRAPHLIVSRAGQLISTIDLFGAGFVLLAGPDGDAWVAAAVSAATKRGLSLRAYRIGEEIIDEDGEWTSRYGAGKEGAVLIRPDGFVAWRSETGADAPFRVFNAVLDQVLGEGPRVAVGSKE
jgi:aklavinone 12-hydroxylase